MDIGVRQMVEGAKGQVAAVSPLELKERIDRGEVDLIVDVREGDEYRAGHLPDAINVPRGVLELNADPSLPATNPALSANPEGRVVVYCTKAPGFRSLTAAGTLGRMGYSNVVAMPEGLDGWSGAGLPTERDGESPIQ